MFKYRHPFARTTRLWENYGMINNLTLKLVNLFYFLNPWLYTSFFIIDDFNSQVAKATAKEAGMRFINLDASTLTDKVLQ